MNTSFKYDSGKTTKDKATLQTLVTDKLSTYNESELKSFSKVFRHSYVSGIIDETDGEAIIQSTLEASQAAGHSPALGDARPLDFIRQVHVTAQTIMFEIYFPISEESL